MLYLVCQFEIRILPFLFDFFELKERPRTRKTNSQSKLLYDTLRDCVSVTICRLYATIVM